MKRPFPGRLTGRSKRHLSNLGLQARATGGASVDVSGSLRVGIPAWPGHWTHRQPSFLKI
jgi:hypothetical protein